MNDQSMSCYSSNPVAFQFAPVRQKIQRITDVMIALSALALLSPLMVALWLTIRLSDGGPGLFRQQRLGRGGEIFTIYKFRSMRVDAEKRLHDLLTTCGVSRFEWNESQKLRNDPRTTAFGRFLRCSSLDELPQLFNILRGDMSLIGPRPIVLAEVSRYGRWIRHYTSVRPGLTGLWQVSGRSLTTYRRRVAADVVYVRRRTFLLKTYILLATIPAVVGKRGSV